MESKKTKQTRKKTKINEQIKPNKNKHIEEGVWGDCKIGKRGQLYDDRWKLNL